jgi:hypothetical protein
VKVTDTVWGSSSKKNISHIGAVDSLPEINFSLIRHAKCFSAFSFLIHRARRENFFVMSRRHDNVRGKWENNFLMFFISSSFALYTYRKEEGKRLPL